MHLLNRAFVSLLALATSSVFASGVEGLWSTPPKAPDDAHIQVLIAPCEKNAERRCGSISAYFSEGSEKENEIVGKLIIKNMRKQNVQLWKGGTVWAPDEDKTYKAKLELLNSNTLKVSGCVFGGLICRGQEWVRVQP